MLKLDLGLCNERPGPVPRRPNLPRHVVGQEPNFPPAELDIDASRRRAVAHRGTDRGTTEIFLLGHELYPWDDAIGRLRIPSLVIGIDGIAVLPDVFPLQ